jgi:hypothetical protein
MRTHKSLSCRSFGRAALLLGVVGALQGCGNEKLMSTLGLTRDAPDEFRVTTRAPLSMPADFDLPTPRPGASRPQELSERQQAEQALVPSLALENTAAASPTPGQDALVAAAGPQPTPDIRARVDAEAVQDADQRTLVQRMLFWQTPPDRAVVVDPAREAQRLRGNAALGTDVRAGDTAVEQPKRRSFIDSLF